MSNLSDYEMAANTPKHDFRYTKRITQNVGRAIGRVDVLGPIGCV